MHPAQVNAKVNSTGFLTSDGVRLHVLEGGVRVPGRPVIAFVPGWSMPASLWSGTLAALAINHQVAALDPRGQGESEIPATGYTLERRAADIGEFVARYPQVVLVAWSLGALEALEYLHVNGDGAISALVIVDSSVGEGPAPPASPVPQEGGFQAELRRDRPAALDAFVRALFRTGQREAELVALREGALRMPLEASLALFPGSRIPREHWREIVYGFSKPLLYVVTPQFAAQSESLKMNRPATRIALFASAGHALFVDEPERFSALLSGFVSGLARQTGAD